MRLPGTSRGDRRDGNVAMTPMIDVVFLLLVFFLWTASFQISEQILPSNVSAESAAGTAEAGTPPPEEDFDDVVIRILWSEGGPRWLVNASPAASLQEVRQSLARIAAVKADAPVIVHPEPEVLLGDVIDVYDATRLEGFQQVQFAAAADAF